MSSARYWESKLRQVLYPRPGRLRLALQYRGSVIPAIMPPVLLCTAAGIVISLLHTYVYPLSLPILGTVIPTIVLGLLLVFRTNTAYERFWEGRKLWGLMVNTSRNLTRLIWVAIPCETEADRQAKVGALHLILAFAIATKQHLRQEPLQEIAPFLTPDQLQALATVQNPPLRIAFWLEDYLHRQYRQGKIPIYQLTVLSDYVGNLVDVVGGSERIIKTPIPLAYAIHLKQLLLLYCLLLPFQLVGQLGIFTGLVVGLIAFTLFGVEEIGLEIENPFGRDCNDLPLDAICQTMQQNIQDLIDAPLMPFIAPPDSELRSGYPLTKMDQ
ncbi:bestrophin family ion channel [Thermosynechococcaceae cyanobacterium BACA0444]|uniref:Bestrophin family ion channel n=1 Tax=Pseudocalidococcus azoricus BACA0444 TaxID=2918990 RepID=A0AAE4FRN3_9CYAN|nr:bestrophin family ion channel [Pseudocalidococcus azoricus]MDS3860439.1 bestrophin family ion channel [Pseudocalidococcus azoricus BACA0444]